MPIVGLRTELQREEDLVKVARWNRKGYSQRAIAEKIGVSQRQISSDIDLLNKRYQEKQHKIRDGAVNELDEQIDDLMVEHWEAYELSRLPIEKTVVEKRLRPMRDERGKIIPNSARMVVVGETTTTEGRLPDSQRLIAIAHLLKFRSEMHGWTAPKKVNVQRLTIAWDELMKKMDEEKDLTLSVDEELKQHMEKVKQIGLKEIPGNANGESK